MKNKLGIMGTLLTAGFIALGGSGCSKSNPVSHAGQNSIDQIVQDQKHEPVENNENYENGCKEYKVKFIGTTENGLVQFSVNGLFTPAISKGTGYKTGSGLWIYNNGLEPDDRVNFAASNDGPISEDNPAPIHATLAKGYTAVLPFCPENQ